MSENLIKEYRERLEKIKGLIAEISDDSELNVFLELQPKLEKKIFELGMLLDLSTSSKEEEYAEGIVETTKLFEKNFPRTSRWFSRMKNKVLSDSQEGGEQ
jgi:hypothetical protein